jgi:hypothetical protein
LRVFRIHSNCRERMLAGGRTSGVALYIRSSALDFQTASKSGLPDLQTSVFVSAMPCGPDHRQHFRSRNQSALGVYPIRALIRRGRRGTPRTSRSSRPDVQKGKDTSGYFTHHEHRKNRHPARSVSRLAPHEPRWTYQAFLLGKAPLSTAGGPLTGVSWLGHENARPGGPCDARLARRTHTAWAAASTLRTHLRPPLPIRIPRRL